MHEGPVDNSGLTTTQELPPSRDSFVSFITPPLGEDATSPTVDCPSPLYGSRELLTAAQAEVVCSVEFVTLVLAENAAPPTVNSPSPLDGSKEPLATA